MKFDFGFLFGVCLVVGVFCFFVADFCSVV